MEIILVKLHLSDIIYLMKNIFYPFLTLMLIVFANISDASAQQVNAKIQEVYGDKTQEMVVNHPNMLEFLNTLLEKRIKIEELPAETDRSKYARLSQVGLLNKYNSSLQRDAVFNPETFNALKYDLDFSSNSTRKVYVVDNTNYIIIIEPQTISH